MATTASTENGGRGPSPPRPGLSNLALQRTVDPLRLRLILAVKRLGSISSAAEACSIGQPSASIHLQALEAAAGHRLVQREGRGSRLTEAGHVVARQATQVLQSLEVLAQELEALAEGSRSVLSVAACEDFGNYRLPEALCGFSEHHPEVEVSVRIETSEEVRNHVARGEVHVGLAGQVRAVGGVVSDPLFPDELLGIAMPGELVLQGDRVSLEELAGRTLLLPKRGSSTRIVGERYMKRVGYRPEKTCELDSVEAIKRVVRRGFGVAFLSRLAIAEEVDRGELVPFRLPGLERMNRPIDLIKPEHRDLTPAEQAYVDTLAACCRASASPALSQ